MGSARMVQMAKDGLLQHAGLSNLQNGSSEPILCYQTPTGQEFRVFYADELQHAISLVDLARRAPNVRSMRLRFDPQIANVSSDEQAHRQLVSTRANHEPYRMGDDDRISNPQPQGRTGWPSGAEVIFCSELIPVGSIVSHSALSHCVVCAHAC
eukprot:5030488-Pyramimonas_sp.AAC.1